MAADAQLSLDLPVPPSDAFDAACRALSAAGFTLTSIDPALGIVSARTGANPSATDGGLDIYVQPVTMTSSTVILRPAAPSGATGWGRSERQAAALLDAIRAQSTLRTTDLPPPPLPPPPGH